jgi:hypothetical protein
LFRLQSTLKSVNHKKALRKSFIFSEMIEEDAMTAPRVARGFASPNTGVSFRTFARVDIGETFKGTIIFLMVLTLVAGVKRADFPDEMSRIENALCRSSFENCTIASSGKVND